MKTIIAAVALVILSLLPFGIAGASLHQVAQPVGDAVLVTDEPTSVPVSAPVTGTEPTWSLTSSTSRRRTSAASR